MSASASLAQAPAPLAAPCPPALRGGSHRSQGRRPGLRSVKGRLAAVAMPRSFARCSRAPGPSGHESRAARVWREAASAFAEVTGDIARHVGRARAGDGGRGRSLASSGTSTRSVIVTHIDERASSPSGRRRLERGGARARSASIVLTKDGELPGVVGRAKQKVRKGAERSCRARRPAHRHRREGRRGGAPARRGPATRPCRRRAGRAAERARRLALAGQPARRVRRARGGAARRGGRRRAGRRRRGRGGAGGGRRLRRRARRRSRSSPRRDRDRRHARDRRARAATRRSRASRARLRAGDRARLDDQPEASSTCSQRRPRRRGSRTRSRSRAGTTSTDADAMYVSRAGVPTGLVSIPLRYMHSPAELVAARRRRAVRTPARRLRRRAGLEPARQLRPR